MSQPSLPLSKELAELHLGHCLNLDKSDTIKLFQAASEYTLGRQTSTLIVDESVERKVVVRCGVEGCRFRITAVQLEPDFAFTYAVYELRLWHSKERTDNKVDLPSSDFNNGSKGNVANAPEPDDREVEVLAPLGFPDSVSDAPPSTAPTFSTSPAAEAWAVQSGFSNYAFMVDAKWWLDRVSTYAAMSNKPLHDELRRVTKMYNNDLNKIFGHMRELYHIQYPPTPETASVDTTNA